MTVVLVTYDIIETLFLSDSSSRAREIIPLDFKKGVTPATYEIPISAPVLPSRKHMRQRANHHCRKGLGGLTYASSVKPSEFIALELSVLAPEERPCWTSS
jgi:ABC-type nitrate/sulfonate/bicarbonate transport system ATPase subunit